MVERVLFIGTQFSGKKAFPGGILPTLTEKAGVSKCVVTSTRGNTLGGFDYSRDQTFAAKVSRGPNTSGEDKTALFSPQ
jgi:hypothetical protein